MRLRMVSLSVLVWCGRRSEAARYRTRTFRGSGDELRIDTGRLLSVVPSSCSAVLEDSSASVPARLPALKGVLTKTAVARIPQFTQTPYAYRHTHLSPR